MLSWLRRQPPRWLLIPSTVRTTSAIQTSAKPTHRAGGMRLVVDADADGELQHRRQVLQQADDRQRQSPGGGGEEQQRDRR